MCQISWRINGLKNGLQTQHTEWVVGGCYILFQGKSGTFFRNILILRPLKGQTTFLWPISYIFLGHACIYNDLNHIKCYTYTRTCQENAMEAIFNQLSNNMICQPKNGPVLKICVLFNWSRKFIAKPNYIGSFVQFGQK